MGFCAINKNSINGEYVPAYRATKEGKYICIECKEDLIFKKGDKMKPHFAHFPSTNSNGKRCDYYDHPGESQIHKEGKRVLAQYLDKNRMFKVKYKTECKKGHEIEKIQDIIINRDWKIIEEHPLPNKYRADIAIVDNNNVIRFVIEVYYKHKTESERDEPWFEIDTEDILEKEIGVIECRRKRIHECRGLTDKYLPIPFLKWKYGKDRDWRQDIRCIGCNKEKYFPIYNVEKRKYYALCRLCEDDPDLFVNKLCSQCGSSTHKIQDCHAKEDINKYPLMKR